MSNSLTLADAYRAIMAISGGIFDIYCNSSVYATNGGWVSGEEYRPSNVMSLPNGEVQYTRHPYFCKAVKGEIVFFDPDKWETSLGRTVTIGMLYVVPKVQPVGQIGGGLLTVSQAQPYYYTVHSGKTVRLHCKTHTKPPVALEWQKKIRLALNKAKRNPAKPTVFSGRG